MEYELKHYYRVKYALVCARQSFLKNPPKDDFEEYAKKVIDRAYFIILNKIDELDGANEKFLEYYQKYIEKCIKL
jgi:GTPase involved in cell partitioning and DNA repair